MKKSPTKVGVPVPHPSLSGSATKPRAVEGLLRGWYPAGALLAEPKAPFGPIPTSTKLPFKNTFRFSLYITYIIYITY